MPSQHQDLLKTAVKSVRGALVALTGFSLVINLLMLTGPLFMLQIYDRVLPAHSVSTLVVLAILVGLLYLFYGILESIRGRVLGRIARRIDEQLADRGFEVMVRLPTLGADLAGRFMPTRDLETIRQFLAGPAPATVFDLPWMPIYLAIIFMLHPVLGLVATGAAIVIVILALINEFAIRPPIREAAAAHSREMALVDDARRNAEVMGTMGMLANLRHVWAGSRRDYLDNAQVAGDRGGGFSSAIKAARFTFQSAILGVGAYLAIYQVASPGTMIAAAIIMSRALAPIDQAVVQWRSFMGARQSLQNLRQALAIGGAGEARTELPRPERSLAVQNLSVAPPGTRKLVLVRMNFALEAGDGLGIIGPSGSGKSTLARALVGVWTPAQGTVRLDGAELAHLGEETRARHIGYLPQDVALFDGTVAQNIARFDPRATSQDIVVAAELAGANEMILALPGGFETRIGPGGTGLSAGQRQRIALARAVYGDPFLVVLDEPNSNLDAEGDQALADTVKTLGDRGKIVVVIAHRPSAIAHVKQILVLNAGQQSAFGPKEDILPKVLTTVSNERDSKPARSRDHG